MANAFVKKDIKNGDIGVITGDLNGLMMIEPLTDENKDNKRVRIVEGLFRDLLDQRIYGKDRNYIIKKNEYCKVILIEDEESEKVG